MAPVSDEEKEERIQRANLARDEARKTITEQTNTLSDIDEKSIQIFRINIVVASILATGFSIAVSSEVATYDLLITKYTIFGGLLLFISIILSSVTYTSTSERIGIAREAIEESILDRSYDYDLVDEEIALEYGKMIEYNFKKNASNALLFTLTLMFAVAAIVYLTIGIVDIYQPIPVIINGFILVFFVIFGKLSGLYGTTKRWREETDPSKRFKRWSLNLILKLKNFVTPS